MSGKSEPLWTVQRQAELQSVSRDHQRFIVGETLTDIDNNLYLVERGKPTVKTLLTPHKGEVRFDRARRVDGRQDALLHVERRARVHRPLRDGFDDRRSRGRSAEPKWDVEGAGFSRNWKYFFYVVNADGQTETHLPDATTMKPVSLPAPPPGSAWVPLGDLARPIAISAARSKATLRRSRPTSSTCKTRPGAPPSSIRCRRHCALARWSSAISSTSPSFDGKRFRPSSTSPRATGRSPRSSTCTAGRPSQSRREFSSHPPISRCRRATRCWCRTCAAPPATARPTRASTTTHLGGGPLKDVVACKKWLVEDAPVDAANGGGDGRQLRRLHGAGGGDLRADRVRRQRRLLRRLRSEDAGGELPAVLGLGRRVHRQEVRRPEDPADAGYQHDRSPIHFVDKIQRPLLVVQGDRDARVKKDQSDRIVDALKRKVPVHYLVLENEGHGFSATTRPRRLSRHRSVPRPLPLRRRDRRRHSDPDGPASIVPSATWHP